MSSSYERFCLGQPRLARSAPPIITTPLVLADPAHTSLSPRNLTRIFSSGENMLNELYASHFRAFTGGWAEDEDYDETSLLHVQTAVNDTVELFNRNYKSIASILVNSNDLEEVLRRQAGLVLAQREVTAAVLQVREAAGPQLVDAALTVNALATIGYEILERRMEAWEVGEATDGESEGDSAVSDVESDSESEAEKKSKKEIKKDS